MQVTQLKVGAVEADTNLLRFTATDAGDSNNTMTALFRFDARTSTTAFSAGTTDFGLEVYAPNNNVPIFSTAERAFGLLARGENQQILHSGGTLVIDVPDMTAAADGTELYIVRLDVGPEAMADSSFFFQGKFSITRQNGSFTITNNWYSNSFGQGVTVPNFEAIYTAYVDYYVIRS